MANGGAPPCCTRCGEFDRAGGYCRLLAAPTLDNRRRLLTMPCDVQRLLTQRFRAYGEDVAREAILLWLSPGWGTEDVARSFGRAPRDARLWLTSWPYLYLGRTAVRRVQQERAERGGEPPGELPAPPRPDPSMALRVARALDRVHRVDPVSHAMLLDFLRDRFDARRWCALLECSEATVTDRKYLGIYRYAAYFHEVLESVQPQEAAMALAARRFSPGDPDDGEALDATRAALRAPELSMGDFRARYREGALRSLALLGAPDALGPEAMAHLGTAFRRVLRVD
ncbi:MAG: hypothetical protein IT372_03275 [Polyangiaceae bacterium]|nr:hypothetical protein [Polyangiaceae bacterium]